ncbi:MAG: AAA family ATPase [Firmicutes bacterium]|nr:AAA family ATPase [Bacillota bacterium]
MSLRPTKLKDFIGQEHIKDILRISIEAAKLRDEALDHVLLTGPAGMGKTTLAFIIAEEMGAECKVINGATIEGVFEIESILRNINPLDVIFIDEIHRLPRQVEEFLYHPMEDSYMTEKVEVVVPSKKYPYLRVIEEDFPELLWQFPNIERDKWERTGEYALEKVEMPPFTLIGATTQPGDLSKPLRDRFQLSIPQLRHYDIDELILIAKQKCTMLDISITDSAAKNLAKRSRGVARVCVNYIRRCRDLANIRGLDSINDDVVNVIFKTLSIDEQGLGYEDREYLRVLANGEPRGVMALSYALSKDKNTIENVIEPYLLRLNLIERTPRGRVITQDGKKYIKNQGW